MLMEDPTMKCGIVSLSTVARNGGRLDPEYYLDPTREIDREIAAAEKVVEQKTRKLEVLAIRRRTALQKFREDVRPFLRKTDEEDPR